MENIKDAILTFIEKQEWKKLAHELAEKEPIEVANLIEELSVEEAVIVFRLLSRDTARDIFGSLSPEIKKSLV